jgi:hypothetical protein
MDTAHLAHSLSGYAIIDVLQRRCDGQRLLVERGHWLAALKAERLALVEAMFTSMQPLAAAE